MKNFSAYYYLIRAEMAPKGKELTFIERYYDLAGLQILSHVLSRLNPTESHVDLLPLFYL